MATLDLPPPYMVTKEKSDFIDELETAMAVEEKAIHKLEEKMKSYGPIGWCDYLCCKVTTSDRIDTQRYARLREERDARQRRWQTLFDQQTAAIVRSHFSS